MKVIPQYSVVGPYNYDSIILLCVIKKIMLRDMIQVNYTEICILFKNKKLCRWLK